MMSAGPRRGRPTCREHKRFRQSLRVLAVLLVCLLFLGGCGSGKSYAKKRPLSTGTVKREKPAAAPKPKKQELPRLGYTIQAGAFKSAENAARFAETLKEKGLDATYFVAKTGLYRVSFGNFKQREDAESVAVILKSLGVIEDYYLVTPEQYTVAKSDIKGKAYLRRELVKTSRTFLGVPYLWGGTSPEEGFDCSGLTMTVYRLNGLELPRTSREQFAVGEPVERSALKEGDLVFFATRGGRKVSHVGIYIGGDRFIHAPRQGKRIGVDSLTSAFWGKRYLGARSYL